MGVVENLANAYATTLANALAAGASSLLLDDSTGAPAAPFRLVVSDGPAINPTAPRANLEIIYVGARSGNTCSSLLRGQEGTADVAHAAGSVAANALTVEGLVQAAGDLRFPDVGSTTPVGGLSGQLRVGDGRLWVNDGGIWRSLGLLTAAGFYGSAVAMDGLGNIQVGGSANAPANLLSAYRFRAKSSSIESVRIQIPNSGVGYSGGTGGKIEVSIREDDGSANHFPSATVLGTPVVLTPGIGTPPPGTGNYPLVTFPAPIAVTPGALYHVHFRNTDAAPTVNFSSIDMIVNESLPLPSPKQGPRWPESDWGINVSAGSWEGPLKYGLGQDGSAVYTPIMVVTYEDGTIDGIGYNFSELGSGKKNIGGNAKVREAFTVTELARRVIAAHVRVRRVSGSGDLTIRLETSAGVLIEESTVANASVPTAVNAHWVGIPFGVARTLEVGSSYNLVLSAPSGTVFETFGIEDGSTRGFPDETYFGDGKGQFTTDGSTWNDLLAGSRTDLQFYFVVA